ncbi:multiprotein-bridging factor 1 family protein [Streptomyces sp. NPDC057555]|uniref:helix-turn-helix domain-containing protein n=1 Tax=Streptomyces sp. NPDC057555 TaxID=3346166 RepID=UPI0036BE2D9D
MRTPKNFGSELRRLRQEAGLSLGEFAVAMNYDKGHLSKVERGLRRASIDLARRCDALFGADGELQRLAERELPQGEPGSGDDRLLVDRRKMLTAGTGTLISLGLGAVEGGGSGSPEGMSAVAPFRAQFDQMRLLGQSTDPGVLLPLLKVQTRTVIDLAAAGSSRDRARLLALAARFAEYTGWMAQEAGDEQAAFDWTADAAELGQAGGDRDLASYALVRRALVALYRSDAAQTIGLASQVRDDALPPRIRGLAAQREAQGHALAGDERACRNGLDRARELLDRAGSEGDGGPVIGTSHLTDAVAMVTGWCLHDLGRPRTAARILDRECSRIAPTALRTRARYGMRRALAHAAAGEIEHSCEIAGELLPLAATAPSATVNTDVRRLARELSRFRSNRAVRDLQPALAQALRPTAR